MTEHLPLLILSFLPGIAWLSYIRHQDRHAPEPLYLVIFVFVLGMLATMPASISNVLAEKQLKAILPSLASGFSPQGLALLQTFVFYFWVVGPVEECCKYLVVRLSIYYNKDFDEPIDSLVYSAAAALGFASVENLLYAVKQGQEVLYLRALLSVPGHLFFSAIWAFGIARSKFANRSSLPSLLLAAFLHGLYDVMLVAFGQLGNSRLGLLLVIPLMGIMAFMMRKRIKALLQSSGPQQEGRRQKDGLLRVTLSTLPPIRRAKAKPKEIAPVQAWCRHCQSSKETTTKQCPTCGNPLAFAPKL